MKMGIEDLTFSDRKNSYDGNEQVSKTDNEIDEQPEIKDRKEMEAMSSNTTENFYKGNKTSPRGKAKSTMFLRGWKSIGKIMGFKKTERFIDSTIGKAAEESNTQDVDPTVTEEVKTVQEKESVTKVSVTKEVISVKDKEDVFEEEPVKETAPIVIKEQVRTVAEMKESIKVRDDSIGEVDEEPNTQGIDSRISLDRKAVQNKKIVKTASVTKEGPVKEAAPKVIKEQAKTMPEESNKKVIEKLKTVDKDTESLKAKRAEGSEKEETVKREGPDGIEREECKDIEKQVGEKESETTILMSLVDNINSTKTYLESDESQNSAGEPNKSTTQETFFKLIDIWLEEDKISATSDSREKTQTFSTSKEKVDNDTRSQINTISDIFKKRERVKSSKTEDKFREKSSKTGNYSDHEDRKPIKKFEKTHVNSEDQKKDYKKGKQSEPSSDVDQLADTVSRLRIFSTNCSVDTIVDRKKTRDKKKVWYLERGADKGKVERRQQITAKLAPYTPRPTISVNLGNLSGGHCVPGRESSTDSLPITIRNDENYYSNNTHLTAMVDGRSFVQYDVPNVQQHIAPFAQQNIAQFLQQNIATSDQQNIPVFVQQDVASLTLQERETSTWEDIEFTPQDLDFLSLLADPNSNVLAPGEFTNISYENDAVLAMSQFATPCSPDISNGMDGETVPWESYCAQNSPERIPYQNLSLENSPISQTGSSPTQFNNSPSIDKVENGWIHPISQGQISPEWIYPNIFPENSPISHGSPGSLYSSSDWNQRNGDSSSFSSLESPPISGNENNLLNKQAPEIHLSPIFGVVQPNIQGMISNTYVDSNFGQNQPYLLPSEVSVNIDPSIMSTSSVVAGSIQDIRNELESSQVNVASKCQRCPDDSKSATDVLGEEFANLDPEQQRNILSKVHGFNEEDVMECFDSLLQVCENPNPSSLLQHFLFSVCDRLLMSDSTKTKFFQTNEMGQTVLDRAVLNCPQMPILSRYLAECCIIALPNPPPDKDCVIDRSDADRNGLLHRAVSKGESSVPHLAGLLALNRQNHIFDVNQKNADGYSPLHLALTACSGPASSSGDSPVCRGTCLKLAHLLIEHGNADPNIKAHKNGNTPLHVAVDTKACASNLVSLLLRHKAIISATNYSKLTPVDLAKLVSKSSSTEVSREVVKIMKDFIRRQRINNNNRM